ncbi:MULTISPECIES: oxygenase MpaB family protein [Actinomadura]|uniref:oxygenase MpaB family protein n=1 Tax=Actinomadura TaxID=1988 RepID=UPI00197A9E72|nr:oxygenase MpaB family protein [Actinomadura geliboluensis]
MPHLDTPAGPPTDSAAPAARPAGAIPGRAETDRLREIHKGIKGVDAAGRRYHPLNPEAYLWVHATLYHGMVDPVRLRPPPRPGQGGGAARRVARPRAGPRHHRPPPPALPRRPPRHAPGPAGGRRLESAAR